MLILTIGATLAGCQVTEKTANPVKQNPQLQSKLILGVTQYPGQNHSWTKLSEYSGDLDGDGTAEQLELLTMAGRDEKGQLVWDDGQKWLLLVRDGENYFPLFSDYVQIGSVYFNVAKFDQDHTGTLYGQDHIPRITVLVSTGANFKLANYIYRKDQKGYQEEPIYNSQAINHLFTSIPPYQ